MTERRERLVLLALFFVSGAAALIYQVLWVRELGLLFGSTAQAAALTIAVFFTGIATGGAVWGRRAPRLRSSLRGFGWLEVGVAVTALGHLVLIDVYHAVVPVLVGPPGGHPVAETAVKIGVATVILLPPSFLMGGTLPLMTQHLVRSRDRLGTTGTAIYAVNTAGSALGALAAGFVLPLALGIRGAYLLAVGLDLAVGTAAVLLARRGTTPAATRAPAPDPSPAAASTPAPDPSLPDPSLPDHHRLPAPSPQLAGGLILAIAAVSGAATLAIEVVWTRLFSQVLQNSAQTYALVLTAFLLALAAGAGLANLLARQRRLSPTAVLGGLLTGSAVVAATSPWWFHRLTDGLRYLGGDLTWGAYLGAVSGLAALVILLPGTVLGAVLPYQLRLLQTSRRAPGHEVGRLVAANTTGGIVGSLLAGFVLLPLLGAWRSLLVVAASYGGLVVVLVLSTAPAPAQVGDPAPPPAPASRRRRPAPGQVAVAATAAVATVGVLLVDTSQLTTIRVSTARDEQVVELREGSQATVAVLARGADRLIRVNNWYTLGGTRGLDSERNQTVVPMLTHPDPARVFTLGLGTGITAGAALAFPVDRLVVCELIRDVVEVSQAHFTPWIGGLFEDPRAVVHAEDGRACLRRTDERFDVINADLFTPWEAGTGNLYTVEHYTTARERLAPGGIYVQWMPLYQVSDQELGIVARTMDEVFDQVLLWRGDLFSQRSIVALVGQVEATPLDPAVLAVQARHLDPGRRSDAFYEALGLRMYVGNLTASGVFADRELNTDDRPVIEHLAPRTQREARGTGGSASFLVGEAREAFYAEVAAGAPTDDDPFLVALDDTQRGYVEAGALRSRARWLEATDRGQQAEQLLARARALEPADALADVSPARVLLPRITGRITGRISGHSSEHSSGYSSGQSSGPTQE